MEKIIIIGGGIGGLAMANCLQLQGLGFELYEQAPRLTEVGAGIGMSKSALDIFEKIGVSEKIRLSGSFIKYACVKDSDLNLIRELPVELDSICIHRARLIKILGENIPASKVHLDKRVKSIDQHSGVVHVVFEDKTTVSAKCVIVADGINSVVRNQTFPDIKIRYADQVIWRGLTKIKLPTYYNNRFVEIWDSRKRFLFVPMDEEHVFWLAVQKGKPGGKDNPATIKTDLFNDFLDFNPLVKDLITNSQNFIRNDLADLGSQPRKWASGNIVFLGDAIHATTPNLAQGACQAIEDAYALSVCLRKHAQDLPKSFSAYQALRQKKAMLVVNTSWRLGQMAHTANPLLQQLFKQFWRFAPDSLFKKQEQAINDLSYTQAID
ncbi:MAG TPA: FAD-dependent monooxygenase [Hymenobacter sp.]|jgi:2-polyprenyl-6-methoxyphenol hydroxylase-like FAD-dependent oxidoreductase